MSPNREDYIKILYQLMEERGHGSNKAISQGLGVAPASVTEMIGKLKNKDLVFAEGQKLFLTEKGLELARDLLSRHRLWETFLMDKLGYLPSEVHSVAEVLEHVTDEQLIDRLNDFLGRPAYCPHGGAIYRNGGEPLKRAKPLWEGTSGERGTVVRIFDRGNVVKETEGLGLEIYDKIEIKDRGEDYLKVSGKFGEGVLTKDAATRILYIS